VQEIVLLPATDDFTEVYPSLVYAFIFLIRL